jgi:catechol 2,3-dioxygenase-like lactoylglutathione lyase family enzyme
MTNEVSISYIVNNVDDSIKCYTEMLDFKVEMHPAVEFAILSRGNLGCYSANQEDAVEAVRQCPTEPFRLPEDGTDFEIEVDDLESLVDKLEKAGCRFRNEIVTGVGGKQILLQDPSGNLIELFQYFQKPPEKK